MTDTTTPQPERPFDPHVAERLQARLDKQRDLWAVDDDLRELLRQFAAAKAERLQLADGCANWRHKYEETRAKLEAVRAVTSEWHAYATADGPEDTSQLRVVAGHALAQVLHALDGDTDATQADDPR